MASLISTPLIQFRAAYNLPVHAAVENGMFANAGLRVEIEYTPGSAFLVEAVRTGRCTVGHAAADDVIADVEYQANSDLFAFMGLHSGLLSLIGVPDCPTMESLRNKRLAVDARDSGFVFILEKALRDHHISPDEYELVEVGGWESRYHALVEGALCATLLTPPFVSAALEQGCHIIARGEEMAPVYQATVGLAKRSWAAENQGHLIDYIRCYVAATEWCYAPENRARCLDILDRHNGLTGSGAEETLDALLDPEHGLYPKAALNIPGITAALDLRADVGYIASPAPPPEKYFDVSYYDAAIR
jgi:ABC-type nitrate/sulfonate/bicarbonate transport system substrate-binding protein